MGLKSLAQQLPVHLDSQKYLNIASPLGILCFLQIPTGIQTPTEILAEVIGIIFQVSRGLELLQDADKIVLCATNMKDLEGQVEEAIGIASEIGEVFDGIHVGRSMQVWGIKLKCQTNGPLMITRAETHRTTWPIQLFTPGWSHSW